MPTGLLALRKVMPARVVVPKLIVASPQLAIEIPLQLRFLFDIVKKSFLRLDSAHDSV